MWRQRCATRLDRYAMQLRMQFVNEPAAVITACTRASPNSDSPLLASLALAHAGHAYACARGLTSRRGPIKGRPRPQGKPLPLYTTAHEHLSMGLATQQDVAHAQQRARSPTSNTMGALPPERHKTHAGQRANPDTCQIPVTQKPAQVQMSRGLMPLMRSRMESRAQPFLCHHNRRPPRVLCTPLHGQTLKPSSSQVPYRTPRTRRGALVLQHYDYHTRTLYASFWLQRGPAQASYTTWHPSQLCPVPACACPCLHTQP